MTTPTKARSLLNKIWKASTLPEHAKKSGPSNNKESAERANVRIFFIWLFFRRYGSTTTNRKLVTDALTTINLGYGYNAKLAEAQIQCHQNPWFFKIWEKVENPGEIEAFQRENAQERENNIALRKNLIANS